MPSPPKKKEQHQKHSNDKTNQNKAKPTKTKPTKQKQEKQKHQRMEGSGEAGHFGPYLTLNLPNPNKQE